MSGQEKELLMRLLKQSVLTLCRETVTFQSKMEVDGLICITVEDNSHPIVVKIHEHVRKNLPYSGGSFEFDMPSSKRRRLSYEKSCLSSNHIGVRDTNAADTTDSDEMLPSPETEILPFGSSMVSRVSMDDKGSDNADSNTTSKDSDKVRDHSTEERDPIDESQRSDSAERDILEQSPKLSGSSFNDNGSVASHPQGLLCKRCFTIVPDASNLESHNLREHSLFTCKICYKGFTARNNLKRHFRLHTGVKPYKCDICSQGFTRKDDLKAHILRHSYNKPFRCGLCMKGYTDRSCVRNHMAKEHQTRLLHVCPQCGEGFDDTGHFSRHKKTHPEFRNFQCDSCTFIGISVLDLMKHSLTHSAKSFTCKPCDRQFSDPFEYSSHLKSHKSDESFTSFCCCFCTMKLGTYEQFVRHEYLHAQGRTHSCEVCSKQFRYPSDLKAHMSVHREPVVATTESHGDSSDMDHKHKEKDDASSSQYWCTECHVGFSSESIFHSHIYESHESKKQRKDSEKPEQESIELKKVDLTELPSDLSIGSRNSSSSEAGDKAPAFQAGSENVPMVDLSKTKLPKLPMFQRALSTEVRPTAFPDLLNRGESDNEHVIDLNADRIVIKREIMDPDDDLRALQDGISGQPSDYSHNESPTETGDNISFENGSPPGGMKEIVLERIHIRSPGFERVVTPDVLFRSQAEFLCQVCQENFTDFPSFEVHSSTLHRRFVCEYCGKVFTAKPNRERHVRYHTGERPYKCDLCDQTFFRGDDLKYHRTTRHSGVKPFRCNACGMSFTWAKDLDRHMRHYCH